MSLIETLLAPGALTSMLQPIVALEGTSIETHAFECLTRGPAGTNLERADILFDYVRLKHAEARIDRACISTALRVAPRAAGLAKISINVHASTLGRDPAFPEFVLHESDAAGVDPSRLIIEIVEHSPAHGTPAMRTTIAALRREGIAIALDDIGLGQSNYQMILDVRPEYFKIDRYFVAGCHADPSRLAVIGSIAQLAQHFGGLVVAEGIEDERDIEPLTRSGVRLFQGFFFGPPFAASAAAKLSRGAVARS